MVNGYLISDPPVCTGGNYLYWDAKFNEIFTGKMCGILRALKSPQAAEE